jgi:hypothetical protein
MIKRLTTTVPPESGPQSQGLNISYNTVKDITLKEKINGRQFRQRRQGSYQTSQEKNLIFQVKNRFKRNVSSRS